MITTIFYLCAALVLFMLFWIRPPKALAYVTTLTLIAAAIHISLGLPKHERTLSEGLELKSYQVVVNEAIYLWTAETPPKNIRLDFDMTMAKEIRRAFKRQQDTKQGRVVIQMNKNKESEKSIRIAHEFPDKHDDENKPPPRQIAPDRTPGRHHDIR